MSPRSATLPWRSLIFLACGLVACGGDDPKDDEADADGDGWTVGAGDCDDSNDQVYPDAAERCDTIDNDCDGDIDDADDDVIDVAGWFADLDGDLVGAGAPVLACEPPAQYVAVAGDCDDNDALRAPGFTEHCDERDNDCDELIDEDADDLQPFFLDMDQDGHGNEADEVMACTPPEGYVALDDDCDDADPLTYPGAPEQCDGIANGCVALAEDGLATVLGVGTWTTLQDVVDNAPPGARVDICGGVWDAGVALTDDLTLVGVGAGPELRGSGNAPVFSITNATLVLENVHLTNGHGFSSGSSRVGGAIAAFGSEVRLTDVVLDGNHADQGGALYVAGGSVSLDGVTFSDNHATLSGGAVQVDGLLTATDVTFEGNHAAIGAAVRLGSSSDATFHDSYFLGNVATARGGAIYQSGGGALLVEDCTFEDLHAPEGGGVALEGEATLTRAVFDRGRGHTRGGAVFLIGNADVTVEDSTFTDVRGHFGGAIWLGESAHLDLVRGWLHENQSVTGGVVTVDDTSTLNATDVDWGAGADDNGPSDLEANGLTWTFDGTASATCDATAGCQ